MTKIWIKKAPSNPRFSLRGQTAAPQTEDLANESAPDLMWVEITVKWVEISLKWIEIIVKWVETTAKWLSSL